MSESTNVSSQGLGAGSSLCHGRYSIINVLGQGGYGITYLAFDKQAGRYVAIKEFFPGIYCDRDYSTSQVRIGSAGAEEFVQKLKVKFLKEARNLSNLDHEGIVHVTDCFEANGTAYYVMDYVKGDNLAAVVRKNGPMPVKTAFCYIEKVGAALGYIHGLRLNHLDVKPANILLNEANYSPVLIDFGLSKQYDQEGNQTTTTPTGLSHGYAPMEQYTENGVSNFSPETDVYSLAATFYYLVSGVTPPPATQLAQEGLSFPGNVPVQFVASITKAMSARRVDRYLTVDAFITDLRAAMENYIKGGGGNSGSVGGAGGSDERGGKEPRNQSGLRYFLFCLAAVAAGILGGWIAGYYFAYMMASTRLISCNSNDWFFLFTVLFILAGIGSLIWLIVAGKKKRPRPAAVPALLLCFFAFTSLFMTWIVSGSDASYYDDLYGYGETSGEKKGLRDAWGNVIVPDDYVGFKVQGSDIKAYDGTYIDTYDPSGNRTSHSVADGYWKNEFGSSDGSGE